MKAAQEYAAKGDVYNTAVSLSLEMGENWKQPIQSRLRGYFPNLPEEEADRLDSHCREMMSYSIRLAEKYFFEQAYSYEQALSLLTQEYPQLDERNLTNVFAQAEWYARK